MITNNFWDLLVALGKMLLVLFLVVLWCAVEERVAKWWRGGDRR